jgi:hypothetical protein
MKNKEIEKTTRVNTIEVYPCTWDETGELIVFWNQKLEVD